jgi:hypothetical protein
MRIRTITTNESQCVQNAREAPIPAASSGLRGEPEETSCAAISAVAR